MDWNVLPPELSQASEHLPALISAMEKKVPYATALLARNGGLRVSVDHREQQVTEMEPSTGLVLTAWNGSFLEEAATSHLAPQELRNLAASFAGGIAVTASGTPIDPGPTMQKHFATACQEDPTALSAKEKLDLCRELHSKVKGLDPQIVNVQVRYSEVLESKAFANRVTRLSQNILRLRCVVVVYVSDGQQMRYNWLIKGGTEGLETAQFSDEELRKLCETAVALLSAEKPTPGMYDAICTPDVAGVIAHEAFGHGVELDMFLKHRARAEEYLGKPVGSPLVNIIDDPSYPGGRGSYFFDDQGQLAAPTQIIREGVFERGISDLFSAHSLGVPRSANGRRESFERKVYARMSNTFFGRGDTPVATLIESVERGMYLVSMSSGMEDPKGWGMQVTSHYGEEILNGKLTGRLFSPVGITGYVPDILQSVSAVGDDFALTGGNCGKGHKEWAPVSSGGPHLRLKARLG